MLEQRKWRIECKLVGVWVYRYRCVRAVISANVCVGGGGCVNGLLPNYPVGSDLLSLSLIPSLSPIMMSIRWRFFYSGTETSTHKSMVSPQTDMLHWRRSGIREKMKEDLCKLMQASVSGRRFSRNSAARKQRFSHFFFFWNSLTGNACPLFPLF